MNVINICFKNKNLHAFTAQDNNSAVSNLDNILYYKYVKT